MKGNQLAEAVVMVRPAAFGYNPETAGSNAFQQSPEEAINREEVAMRAIQEFDAMVEKLRSHNIEVIVVNDTPEPAKPDAVFPNNWFSTHADGTLVLYPMMSKIRQQERGNPVVQQLADTFITGDIIDLTDLEKKGRFLEGTGSIVFDHENKLAYACISPRTNEEALKVLCKEIGYNALPFTALDKNGQEIYHTNVMLAIGKSTLVVCPESIADEAEHEQIMDNLRRSKREIIEISTSQMEQFAGNMLNVANKNGQSCWIMSGTAEAALTPLQLDILKRDAEIITVEIPTIEKLGGGSARCMLAECFLPAR